MDRASLSMLQKLFACFLTATVIGNASATLGVDNGRRTVQDRAQAQPTAEEIEQLRKSIRRLSAEVAQLSRRVDSIEKDRKLEVTRVLLQGEEQRAELLQGKITTTYEKQLALQVRLEQLDTQMRPENIEKLFIGVGSTRPEESREAVRRRLAIERQNVLFLLEALRQERARLTTSLSTADVAIARLRGRLAEAAR